MTTKRWGSLAMRENSATSSRNRGRHSESIIQPGGRRKLNISGPEAACVLPRPLPLRAGLVTRVQSPQVVETSSQGLLRTSVFALSILHISLSLAGPLEFPWTGPVKGKRNSFEVPLEDTRTPGCTNILLGPLPCPL